MINEMTKRERMKCALSGGIPDRVPCAPDISYMVPCRLTGKPFYEVLMNANPPLWKAYIDAVDYFDIDGWFTYGWISPVSKIEYTLRSQKFIDEKGRWNLASEYDTPAGVLRQVNCYFERDSDTPVEKLIKDFKEDFPKIKYLFPKIDSVDTALYDEQKKALGEKGIMCVGCFPPGFQIYNMYFHGNVEAITYAYYDESELFEEFTELYAQYTLRYLELILEHKPDSILTGGSGSITLQSPEIFDTLSLPFIKKATKMCKQACVISGIHSCGKEMHLIKRCAEETELNYVNPLELPPMGDCTIAEARKVAGSKLALMGNLHTTKTMLKGTVREVETAALEAIAAGAANGGFVLSTGDQCGRDTPDENIRAMVRIAKEFGKYPLDIKRLNSELSKTTLAIR